MKIDASDYSIYNRMEDVANQAVTRVLAEETAGCSCEMCREDMQSYLLNQLPPRYVPVLPGEPFPPLHVDRLDGDLFRKVVIESYKAALLVRRNPRHDHERAPKQNYTERLARKALGEILAQEGLEDLNSSILSRLMAEVLNELPPRYTTSAKGDAFARTDELDWGSLAKVYTAIINALKKLELIPSHS